jgi:excisionase family DNA binding protein
VSRAETNNPNREPNTATSDRAPESPIESALARFLHAVADRVESANNGRNSLDLHRPALAQCDPQLDAAALGLVVKEVIELREEMRELRREIPSLREAASTMLSKRQVADRLGVAPRTVDRMVDDGKLAPGRIVGSRRRWTAAEIEEAAR